jgi:hypothetical protein
MVMAAERMDSIYQQAFLQAGVEFRSWLDQPITDPGSRKAEFQFGFRITAAPDGLVPCIGKHQAHSAAPCARARISRLAASLRSARSEISSTTPRARMLVAISSSRSSAIGVVSPPSAANV